MKYLLAHFLLFIILLLGVISLFYLYGKSTWFPYYKKYAYHETKIQTIIPCQENNQSKLNCEPCKLIHVGPLRPQIVEKECPAVKPCPECPICPKVEKLSFERQLKRHLADSNFVFYPETLTLIGLKHERLLEVWGSLNGKNVHIVTYPFTAFSGILGPKIEEGDRQIPEGIYRISHLNPKSKFHLSLRINYPNKFDKKMAKLEKRTNLGGDIMIHGDNRSIGCIAIGDDNIDQLYFLAQKVGIQNIKVILSPVDFRKIDVTIKKNQLHPWLSDLYRDIKQEMLNYKE